MKSLHILLISLAIFGLTSFAVSGQNAINPNAIFNMGVLSGQLSNGSFPDHVMESFATQLESRIKASTRPSQFDAAINANEKETYDAPAMEAILSELSYQEGCTSPLVNLPLELFYTGYELGSASYHSRGACIRCTDDALENGLSELSFLADEMGSEQLMEVTEAMETVRASVDLDQEDLDQILAQNEQLSKAIDQAIIHLNFFFDNEFLACDGATTTAYLAADSACMANEILVASDNGQDLTLLVRGTAFAYGWRYSYDQGNTWVIASTTDSMLTLTNVDTTKNILVQAKPWCENIQSFGTGAEYDSGIQTFETVYGCYPPHISRLYATHITQNSAKIHVNTNYHKIQWKYRPKGGHWKTFTSYGRRSANWTGLSPNRYYEFGCRVWCGHGWSSWSHHRRFKTPGSSCYTPSVSVSNVTSNSATCTVNISAKKRWAFREAGGHWKVFTNYDKWRRWNCRPGRTYECKVQILCHHGWSHWSTPRRWTCPGYTCHKPSGHDVWYSGVTSRKVYLNVNTSAKYVQFAIKNVYWNDWQYFDATTYHKFWVNGLSSNTKHYYAVRVYCNGAWTGWSPVEYFYTKGSGRSAGSSEEANGENGVGTRALDLPQNGPNPITDNSIEINVFPNPSSDYIELQGSNFSKGNVEIFTMSGAKVMNQDGVEVNQRIDVSSLPQGSYVINIKSADGTMSTKRLAVVR